jgi:hypothetical protein
MCGARWSPRGVLPTDEVARADEPPPRSVTGLKAMWAGLDSNQRRRKPADLQSAPFGHFGTYPRRERLI